MNQVYSVETCFSAAQEQLKAESQDSAEAARELAAAAGEVAAAVSLSQFPLGVAVQTVRFC